MLDKKMDKKTFLKMMDALSYSLTLSGKPVEFTTEDGGKMIVGIDTGEEAKNIDYLFEE